jgi:hypothetical protein
MYISVAYKQLVYLTKLWFEAWYGQGTFISSKHPDLLWAHLAFSAVDPRDVSLGYRSWGINLTAQVKSE